MFPGVIPGTPVVPPFAIPDWKNIVLNISNDATFGIPFGGCSADPPTFVVLASETSSRRRRRRRNYPGDEYYKYYK
jgi:hypothetical protein